MRIRPAAGAALVALSLLAACGGDDDDDASSSASPSASGSAAEADESPSIADPVTAMEAAQLEVEDLGEGWTLASTTPPEDDEDDDEPNPLDECMEGDLDDRMEAATVAESEERTFSREGEDALSLPTEVTSSSVALDDAGIFAEMHELLRDDAFADCMTEGLNEQMAQSMPEGGEMTIGDIEVGDGIDPDAVEGATATAITIPFTASAQGLSFDAVMSITVVNVGEVGSSVLIFGPGDDPLPELGVELAGTLAARIAESA